MVDPAKIMSRFEVRDILRYFHSKKKLAPAMARSRTNLTIFRLSACCGLRSIEISRLNMDDVLLNTSRPVIHIKKTGTKGRHNVCPSNPEGKDYRSSRKVPLHWDAGTLADLKAHKEMRLAQGAKGDDPFVLGHRGQRLNQDKISLRWRKLVRRVLGRERASQVTLHSGRHTFPSHALHAGRRLKEVASAMGHKNSKTTDVYLHVLESDNVADVFGDL
jgi:integrase